MNREEMIKRLVDRKMATADRGKTNCIPCLGFTSGWAAPRKDASLKSK